MRIRDSAVIHATTIAASGSRRFFARRRFVTRERFGSPHQSKRNSMNSLARSIVCTLFLLAVCFAAEPSKDAKPATPAAAQPGHLELTLKAWEAHDKSDHEEALKAAEKCIAAFEASAAKIQEKLEKDKAKTSVGEV